MTKVTSQLHDFDEERTKVTSQLHDFDEEP